MNKLINIKETMSSLEIAEVTGKMHKNIMQDIRKMLTSLEIDVLNFGETYLDSSNRVQKCFKLPKRECLILGSGYDVVLRTKIIDRWIKLEEVNRFSLPQTYSEALRELANTNEQKEKALLQLSTANKTIEENKPKVVFADSVIGSSNSILVRDFAKVLSDNDFKIGQNKLYQWLRDNKYLMKDNKPYQNYVEMNLFEVIERSFGSGLETFTNTTTKITGKGQVYFAKKIKG